MSVGHITEHFRWAEARDRRGAVMPQAVEDNVRRLADFLEEVRGTFLLPMRVQSWYRSPLHPVERRKIRPGAHSTGLAVDIHVCGDDAVRLIDAVLKHAPRDFYDVPRIGLGIRQHGPMSQRIIHIDLWDGDDLSPRPAIWSY